MRAMPTQQNQSQSQINDCTRSPGWQQESTTEPSSATTTPTRALERKRSFENDSGSNLSAHFRQKLSVGIDTNLRPHPRTQVSMQHQGSPTGNDSDHHDAALLPRPDTPMGLTSSLVPITEDLGSSGSSNPNHLSTLSIPNTSHPHVSFEKESSSVAQVTTPQSSCPYSPSVRSTVDRHARHHCRQDELKQRLEYFFLRHPQIGNVVRKNQNNLGKQTTTQQTDHLALSMDQTGVTYMNQYLLIKSLGSGSYGDVKLCVSTINGKLYAVKMIHKRFLNKQLGLRHRRSQQNLAGMANNTTAPVEDNPLRKRLMSEIAIMKKLIHKNIVGLHEVIDPGYGKYLMLVMEYMEKGPVCKRIEQPGMPVFKRVDESQARNYFRQMCAGLDYLHYNHIIHGDLKPENILLSSDHHVTITDFGCGYVFRKDEEEQEEKVTTGQLESIIQVQERDSMPAMIGTPAFHAPEMINSREYNPFFADLWALSVCLYCMVCGRLPFQGENVSEVYKNIVQQDLTFPPEVPLSQPLKDLLTAMLDKDWTKRLTMEQIISSTWVQGHDQVGMYNMASQKVPPPFISTTQNEVDRAIIKHRIDTPLYVPTQLDMVKFKPQDCLLRQGEPSTQLYFILSGVVEVVKEKEDIPADCVSDVEDGGLTFDEHPADLDIGLSSSQLQKSMLQLQQMNDEGDEERAASEPGIPLDSATIEDCSTSMNQFSMATSLYNKPAGSSIAASLYCRPGSSMAASATNKTNTQASPHNLTGPGTPLAVQSGTFGGQGTSLAAGCQANNHPAHPAAALNNQMDRVQSYPDLGSRAECNEEVFAIEVDTNIADELAPQVDPRLLLEGGEVHLSRDEMIEVIQRVQSNVMEAQGSVLVETVGPGKLVGSVPGLESTQMYSVRAQGEVSALLLTKEVLDAAQLSKAWQMVPVGGGGGLERFVSNADSILSDQVVGN